MAGPAPLEQVADFSDNRTRHEHWATRQAQSGEEVNAGAVVDVIGLRAIGE